MSANYKWKHNTRPNVRANRWSRCTSASCKLRLGSLYLLGIGFELKEERRRRIKFCSLSLYNNNDDDSAHIILFFEHNKNSISHRTKGKEAGNMTQKGGDLGQKAATTFVWACCKSCWGRVGETIHIKTPWRYFFYVVNCFQFRARVSFLLGFYYYLRCCLGCQIEQLNASRLIAERLIERKVFLSFFFFWWPFVCHFGFCRSFAFWLFFVFNVNSQ